jgi:FMN phosphatase YigB (HAD superfamily)
LREGLPEFIDLFDVRVGSGDIGIAKPDEGIFRHALDGLGVAPGRASSRTTSASTEAASALGMHGFYFTGYPQFAEDIRSLGVAW